MLFKNTPNKSYKIEGQDIWHSRSVGMNFTFIIKRNDDEYYVLLAERGPNAADFNNDYNLIAGYLDWDETGTEAVFREVYEEVNLDLFKVLMTEKVLVNDLSQPWFVQTDPSLNRQNVVLNYGLVIELDKTRYNTVIDFMTKYNLNTSNNEVEGEVGKIKFYSINDINHDLEVKLAFNHNEILKKYYKKIKDETN